VKSLDETQEKPLTGFNSPPRIRRKEQQQSGQQGVAELVSQTQKAVKKEAETVMAAKAQGYTGETCSTCGSARVKRNGSCTVCEDCGTTSGCS